MSEFPTPEIKKQFGDLVNRLSPENLSCDGELPKAQVNAKYRGLMSQWHALEKQIKMKVTEEMAWDWDTESYNKAG
jgi:hypothetical protein